ncbi:hypothetical protein FF38_12958 [Lucilia cuprina]|uniref:Uncharacterized protein n=1 Tax=Lucilia cuprina TaxID=7375 RepID=A0A0L0BZM7_LUCCU|nr:hypothetical protein FF38_12958 [Lucilia cuprina]
MIQACMYGYTDLIRGKPVGSRYMLGNCQYTFLRFGDIQYILKHATRLIVRIEAKYYYASKTTIAFLKELETLNNFSFKETTIASSTLNHLIGKVLTINLRTLLKRYANTKKKNRSASDDHIKVMLTKVRASERNSYQRFEGPDSQPNPNKLK